MKISDIFTQTAVQQNQSGKVDEVQDHRRRGSHQSSKSGDGDSVEISSLARQLGQIHRAVTDDENSQADRIAQLKEQVESGTYAVNSQQVAGSIVSFLQDE